jgi:light-harvesting complex I chlorophyll a/b binding protein 4
LFDDTALQTSITRAATQQRSVSVRAANRPLWFPGAAPPSYLDGSVAGDRGFDPIGLGAEPRAMAWYRAAELVHARWAMLGVAGILAQEITHPEQWWYVVNASISSCR